jgi:hypothetical protein
MPSQEQGDKLLRTRERFSIAEKCGGGAKKCRYCATQCVRRLESPTGFRIDKSLSDNDLGGVRQRQCASTTAALGVAREETISLRFFALKNGQTLYLTVHGHDSR